MLNSGAAERWGGTPIGIAVIGQQSATSEVSIRKSERTECFFLLLQSRMFSSLCSLWIEQIASQVTGIQIKDTASDTASVRLNEDAREIFPLVC
jgi:hypothetical protein